MCAPTNATITLDEIRGMLSTAFPGASIDLQNPRNDGAHYNLTIVSDHFEGMNRVKQHRAVYAALGSAMHEQIHALTLQTMTPTQLQTRQEA